MKLVLTPLFFFTLMCPAWAGTVALAPPTVESNRYVFPIALDGAPGVASMDFQVRYDPAVFTPVRVEMGAGASAAGKLVEANLASPGSYNVLVMGLNQNALPPGEVARVVFERNGDAALSSSRVSVANTTLASADGQVLPSSGSDQQVRLSGTPAEPQDDAEPESPAEPEDAESAPEPEAAPVSEDALGDDVGRSVADAMLSGLSLAPGSVREEKADSDSAATVPATAQAPTPAADQRSVESIYGEATLAPGEPGVATEAATGVMHGDAKIVAEPASGATPETVSPMVAVNDSAGEIPPRTVEDEYSEVAQDVGGNAQQGGRRIVALRNAVIMAFVLGLIVAAVYWSRRRVTRL